jgi:hypothetical protein
MREGLLRYRWAIIVAIMYLAILVSLIWVMPSQAYPTTDDPVLKQKIAMIAGNVPLESLNVEVKLGACPGGSTMSGCYIKEYNAIWIAPDWRNSRNTIAHELGHAFDEHLVDPYDRGRLENVWGIAKQPWITLGGDDTVNCETNGVHCPNEWFADEFAGCAVDSKPHYGPDPESNWRRGWLRIGFYLAPWTPRIKATVCTTIVNIGSKAER